MSDTASQIAAEIQRRNSERATVAPGAPRDAGPRERGRAALQGLTFGGADEAEAYVRSKLGGGDYDTILADVRKKLADYKGARPWESLGYEAGGAALPAIVASVATGGAGGSAAGARLFPTLFKMGGIGAAEGGAYGFGTGEGDAMNRAANVPGGAVAGFIGGVGGYGASRGAASAGGRFLDWAKRSLGDRASRRVEMEMKQVIADSGLTMDEVLQRVENGELIPEMSKTLRSVARGYYAQSRAAGRVLENTYSTRPDTLRKETMDYLQRGLADESDNVLKSVRQSEDALKSAASKEYNDIFSTAEPLGADVVDALKSSLSRVPEAGDDVKRIYRAETGKAPFFNFKEDGTVTFSRPPTLEDAEIIRRGLQSATDRQFRAGAGAVGTAYKSVEGTARKAIDAASEPLQGVRAKWSNLQTAKEAFEEGRKALSKSPDEVELLFEQRMNGGDMEVKAFRAGVADAFRRKASTGSRKSIPRNIASEDAKEGAILRIVFPQDDMDALLGKATRATGAQDAANKILGGSETAVTQGRNRQTGGTLADAAEAAAGNSFALIRLAHDAVKALAPSLTDTDVTKLAQLMVESDANLLRRALTDSTALQKVSTAARDLLMKATQPAAAMSGAAGAPALDRLRP